MCSATKYRGRGFPWIPYPGSAIEPRDGDLGTAETRVAKAVQGARAQIKSGLEDIGPMDPARDDDNNNDEEVEEGF